LISLNRRNRYKHGHFRDDVEQGWDNAENEEKNRKVMREILGGRIKREVIQSPHSS